MGGKEEHDGLSTAPAPSSASSLPKEESEVEVELRLLQALETYPPARLQGMHRHFVLYGLMESLHKSLGRQFSSDEVLQLVDRFFNLEMLKSDDEAKVLDQEDGFSLPQIFLDGEES